MRCFVNANVTVNVNENVNVHVYVCNRNNPYMCNRNNPSTADHGAMRQNLSASAQDQQARQGSRQDYRMVYFSHDSALSHMHTRVRALSHMHALFLFLSVSLSPCLPLSLRLLLSLTLSHAHAHALVRECARACDVFISCPRALPVSLPPWSTFTASLLRTRAHTETLSRIHVFLFSDKHTHTSV